MKSSLVLCVLLGVVLSVHSAAVLSTVEYVNTTTTPTNTFTPPTPTCCMTTFTTTTPPTETTTTTTTTPCNTSPLTMTTTSTTTLPPTATTTMAPCNTIPLTTTTTTTIMQSSPPSESQIMCPSGWEVFQGRCYYFVTEDMTWSQAQSNCALLDSMLVSVHSIQEYGFLQQFTNNNDNQNAWLGGFYLQDQWLWIDGSWFYNSSWTNQQSPDGSNPCLLLSSYTSWTSYQCEPSSFPSICAKSSTSPPWMECPSGWIKFNSRCYYYNSEDLTWPEADASCAGMQASLVSVHSPQEYFFLFQQTNNYGSAQSWLGGFYIDDQWMWLDGSWFYQGFFTEMSPDSINPCLSTFSSNGWSNYPCEQTFPSFCVKDLVVRKVH